MISAPVSSLFRLQETFSFQFQSHHSKMFSRSAPRFLRLSTRSAPRLTNVNSPQFRVAGAALHQSSPTPSRSFHVSAARAKGLQPDSEDPNPPNTQPHAGGAAHVTEPSPLTPEEYYDYSEHYFNVLIQELEKTQEEGSEIEAEYSVSFNFLIS